MTPEEISWLSKVFRKIDVFSNLSFIEMSDLIEGMEKYHYKIGDKIIQQNEKGDAFYIIYKGKVKAEVKKGWFNVVDVGQLGPEQFFGEMALLTDEPRSATVIAIEETDCFVLFKGQFQHLMEKSSVFQSLVYHAQEKRLFEIRKKSE